MYIREKRNHSGSAPESMNMMQLSEETAENPSEESPDTSQLSPETPAWGPPLSPDTPSWGPPSGSENSPGLSPDTPSWGPPLSPDTPSWGPPSGGSGSNGGTVIPPVIVVPGRPVLPNCTLPNCPSRPSSPNNEMASVRFLHAAPGLPAVNIQLGGRRVINDMQYGNSTPYYAESGNQNTSIIVTNAQTGATLYRGSFTFSGQTAYTVAIVSNNSTVNLYEVIDTPCNYTYSGCVRAVNLSPNSGAVDIFLSGYGRIFQRLNSFSSTDYRMISQGTYRASVSEALPCTNNNSVIMAEGYVECNNTRIVIMDSATLNVMNGVTYTLYIIGLAYQFPSVQILPLESDLIY